MAKMTNRERALKRMRAIVPEMIKVIEAATREEAEELAAAIRRAVPVDTGTLRDSIRVEATDDPYTFRIIAGGVPETRKKVRKGVKDEDFAKAKQDGGSKGEFDYARAVEFGTSDTPEQPYFYPTYRARKKAMRRRVTAKARKAIKTAISK